MNYGNGATTEKDGSVGQRVDQIGQSAQQFISEAKGAVSDLSETLDIKGRVERNPYLMIAAAAGVGYVLGGGLFTPMTARMVRLGIRLAALPFVKDELMGMAEAAVHSISTGRGGSSTGGTSGSNI